MQSCVYLTSITNPYETEPFNASITVDLILQTCLFYHVRPFQQGFPGEKGLGPAAAVLLHIRSPSSRKKKKKENTKKTPKKHPGCVGCAMPNLTGCWIASPNRGKTESFTTYVYQSGKSAFESFYGMHLSTCFALHYIPVLTLNAFIGITHLNESLWRMQCS